MKVAAGLLGAMASPPLPEEMPPWVLRRRRVSTAFLAVSVVVIAFGLLLLLLSLRPTAFGLKHYGFGFPFGGGFLGLFLLVWGTLLLVRVAWWRARGPFRGRGGRPWDPAIVQARQRYARGEITREQFLQIVQDLRPPHGPLP